VLPGKALADRPAGLAWCTTLRRCRRQRGELGIDVSAWTYGVGNGQALVRAARQVDDEAAVDVSRAARQTVLSRTGRARLPPSQPFSAEARRRGAGRAPVRHLVRPGDRAALYELGVVIDQGTTFYAQLVAYYHRTYGKRAA